MKIKHFTLLIIIILSVLFTPYAAKIYVQIFGRQYCGFWGPSNPEYFWGFLMNMLLFGSFFSWFLYNKWKIWFCYILPVPIFFLFLQSQNDLIIAVGLAIAGIILAQIFLLINKYIFKIKSEESPDILKAQPIPKIKESVLDKMRFILIIYLAVEFFTGILMGFNAGRSAVFIAAKILSLIILIISIYYVIKKNQKCYLYVSVYAILGIIVQFLGWLDYMALTVYIILAVFSIYKLLIIKTSVNIKNNSTFDRVITNTTIFILILSLLFKLPIFLLSMLSFIELFGSIFTH